MELASRGAPARLSIVSVRTRVVSRRYRRSFVISSGATDELVSLIVEVRAEPADHLVGLGETSPMTAFSGETLAGLMDAIENYLAPAVRGRDAFDVAGLHLAMDRAIRGQRLAKAAIDLAVHDLVGKALGVPVATLLGGRMRDRVPLAWVIGLGAVDEVVEEATRYVQLGFRHIKVKTGNDPKRDLELISALAAQLPEGVELALDANEAYDADTALRILRKMESKGLALVEQPLPRWDLEGMARLCRALDVPVMADESLQSLHDAVELVRRHACDVFNLKILKVGGLYRARQVAAVAEAAGIPVKVGSMPELGLATLAGAHFAAATPAAVVPADLIGPLMVEADVLGSPRLIEEACGGWLTVPDEPGLGGEVVDDDATARVG